MEVILEKDREIDSLCSIWYLYIKWVTHIWGIIFCKNWLFKWTVDYISSRNVVGQQSIPCLEKNWKNEIAYQELTRYLNKKQIVSINEEYNKKYFNKNIIMLRSFSQLNNLKLLEVFIVLFIFLIYLLLIRIHNYYFNWCNIFILVFMLSFKFYFAVR